MLKQNADFHFFIAFLTHLQLNLIPFSDIKKKSSGEEVSKNPKIFFFF